MNCSYHSKLGQQDLFPQRIWRSAKGMCPSPSLYWLLQESASQQQSEEIKTLSPPNYCSNRNALIAVVGIVKCWKVSKKNPNFLCTTCFLIALTPREVNMSGSATEWTEVGLPDVRAISAVSGTFKTELANCFINIHIPLEMNQDQDKRMYLLKKVCKDIKGTENALTEL